MLQVGDTAPDFQLPGTDGEGIETYRLDDYTQEGAVVLAFYPFDFSPVCTRELCNFRDAEWFTVAPDVDVFGISTDSAYAHEAFIEEHDLNFPLLSDADGAVSAQYDVQYDSWKGHPDVAKRATFVLDSSRTIRYAWATDDALQDPDIGEVRDALGDVVSL